MLHLVPLTLALALTAQTPLEADAVMTIMSWAAKGSGLGLAAMLLYALRHVYLRKERLEDERLADVKTQTLAHAAEIKDQSAAHARELKELNDKILKVTYDVTAAMMQNTSIQHQVVDALDQLREP